MKIKALIVDDEAIARDRVRRFLNAESDIEIVGECRDGREAVTAIQSLKPDLVLLDVQMPEMSGFDVLEALGTHFIPAIIFITAYDQYAMRAFEVHALDYLLKPFTAERLQQALERALSRLADETRLRALEAQLAERHGYLRRFTVKQGTRLRLIEEADIFCFISQDHYTCVFFRDRESQHEGIIDLSLTQLLERIDPAAFQQLHRNSIARVAAITALARTRAGELQAELSNGQRLPVSRRQQAALRALIKSA